MTARRLRLILPPWPILLAAGLVFLLLELPLALLRLRGIAAAPDVVRPSVVMLRLFAVLYGVYRVVIFHPFYRHPYREWLERTPWTPDKPLPMGPVHWVWEDGLVLGAFALVASGEPTVDPLRVLALPLLGYGIALSFTLFATRAPSFGYLSLFAFGLAVRLAPDRWACLAAMVVANAIVGVGFRRSLASFHGPDGWLKYQVAKDGNVRVGSAQPFSALGWPFGQLGPDAGPGRRVGTIDAALIGMTVGWWAYAGSSLIPDPRERDLLLTAVLFGGSCFSALIRTGIYLSGYRSPLSLMGRLTSGRWVIPGFDQVFVGPISALVAPFVGTRLLYAARVPADLALPASIALTLFVVLASTPSLTRWRLTGRHRIVPAMLADGVRVG